MFWVFANFCAGTHSLTLRQANSKLAVTIVGQTKYAGEIVPGQLSFKMQLSITNVSLTSVAILLGIINLCIIPSV